MAFDGPLLAAQSLQAVATLPGAFRDLKALISRGGSTQESTEAMQKVINGVRNLSDVQQSLGESKQIHDKLQHLDTELEFIRSAHSHAISEGRFIRDRYQLPGVRSSWQNIQRSPLNSLKAAATKLKYLELRPLTLDADDNPIDGPDWLLSLLQTANEINNHMKAYDEDGGRIDDLIESLEVFSSRIKIHMELADLRILQEYDELRERLHELSIALREI